MEKKKIKIDQDAMTLGDLEEFEELTGMSFSESVKRVKVIDPDTGKQMVDPDPKAKGAGLWNTEMSTKGLMAIIYITLKKDDPELTFADVKNMRLADLDLGGDEDPQEAVEDGEQIAPSE